MLHKYVTNVKFLHAYIDIKFVSINKELDMHFNFVLTDLTCLIIFKFYVCLLAAEKFTHVLDKIGELCESQLRCKDGASAQLELLKFLEQRTYPAKGRAKKKKTLFGVVSWVDIRKT